MEIAKALVLAGRTPYDRPWPSVLSGPKHLVPVANRPILFHHLESLCHARVLEATIAVEPESSRPIRAAVGDGSQWGLAVRYVRWQPRTGLDGALRAARDFIADEPVLVGPADALHRERVHPHIAAFADERLDAMALRLTDCPSNGRRVPATGGYLLSPRAISILLERPEAADDPVIGVRAGGGQVRVQEIDGCLACHGGQEGLLEGNRRMLEDLHGNADHAAYPSCELQGPVMIDPTARIEHSLIRGPVIIGPRCRLSHAYVGPYTSIAADVVIEGSQIEHSIILSGAQLRHVGSRLETSVIGRGARICRSFGLPSALRLSVGDGAEVTLS